MSKQCIDGGRHHAYVRDSVMFCKRCGLRFGTPCEPTPANDDDERVAVELRAAEIAHVTPTCLREWEDRFGRNGDTFNEDAFYLAGVIAGHGDNQ